jgi:hypothetical protein
MSEQFVGAAFGAKGGISAKADISPSFRNHLLAAPPDIIYHYTTQTGLLGIIENKELWATKIIYMNDSTEFAAEVRFAPDSPLEEGGFEPSVPLYRPRR